MPRLLMFVCASAITVAAGCGLNRPIGSVGLSDKAASPEVCNPRRVACAAGDASACAFVTERCSDDHVDVGDSGESDDATETNGGTSDASNDTSDPGDDDGDGAPDASDGCPSNPDKITPGVCGCDAADTDGDGDGAYDCEDECPSNPDKITSGVCGCDAADADGDGADDCEDECPSNPDKITPGVCGCDAADTDGDGADDCEDECPADPRKVLAGVCGCNATDSDIDGNNICDTKDPDILFWVDASLLESLDTGAGAPTDGAPVDTWTDRSVHQANLVTYNTANGQAVYVASHFANDSPAVKFENAFMEARGVDVRPSVAPQITSFAAVRYSEQVLWIARENGFSRRSHAGVTSHIDHVSTRVFDQALPGSQHWQDGVQNASSSTEFSEGEAGIAIGQWIYPWHGYAGAYKRDVTVGEIILFRGALNDARRQKVETYLAKKWGLGAHTPCVDADGDGYGAGQNCLGFDCSDISSDCTTDCGSSACGCAAAGADSHTAATCDFVADYVQKLRDGADTYTLRMKRETLRGPNFHVIMQTPSGAYETYEPPTEVRTYVGAIDELPDSFAAGYLQPDGYLWSVVILDRGTRWTTLGDEIRRGATREPSYSFPTSQSVGIDMAGDEIFEYEIGVDVDHDSFAQHDQSDPEQTVARIERNMCELKAIHLSNAMLKPAVGRVVIRTDENQSPYSGISGTALLDPLRAEWREHHDDALQYCLKVMLVTQHIGGGVAGRGGDFSVSGMGGDGWFMHVGRHELGHNFGITDYDAGSPEGPTINCGNALARFTGPGIRDTLTHVERHIGSKVHSIGGAYEMAPAPPYAALDALAVEVGAGAAAETRIDVLGNDFDANADGLSILSFEPESELGGVVALSRGTGPGGRDEIVYHPAPGGEGLDWFHYVVEDDGGKTATGLVIIRLTVAPPAALWSRETDGDAFVTGRSSSNYGTEETIDLRRSTAGPTPNWTATGWFHFNLSGVDKSNVDVELLLTWHDLGDGAGTATVWGVVDGAAGDAYGVDWHEEQITGANAPYKADLLESDSLRIVGTFPVTWNGTQTFRVSTQELSDWLADDTNDSVTLIVSRSPDDKLISLRSREHPDGGAAVLTGRVAR